MPVYIALQGVLDGLSSIPQGHNALKAGAWLLVLAALKRYFGGARNASERLMHGKVVMMTVRPPRPRLFFAQPLHQPPSAPSPLSTSYPVPQLR